MARLTAFADEISADLGEQITVLKRHGIGHLELRSVGGVNVLKLTPAQRTEIRSTLKSAGMGVSAIASPIGKVRIDEPFEPHWNDFLHALSLADEFETPYIRIFSYYAPEGGRVADHRDEVIRRMRLKAQHAAEAGKVLLHENESRIFGEQPAACVDLLKSVNLPSLRAVFDPANFVHAGVSDVPAAWQALQPYVEYFHIKDYIRATDTIVPAGRGDGAIPEILADAARKGWNHFLALEPHLASGGQFSGFTGPVLFATAVEALRSVCERAGVAL